MPDFPSYGKTPRWNKPVLVTEKIDGTNGLVYISPEGVVRPGSRNRWLDEGQPDNHGFGAWVRANAEALAAELGPGHHYGEWWGGSIAKRYPGFPKVFSLFNAERWTDAGLTVCSVVPVLASLDKPDSLEIAAIVSILKRNGSVVAPGCVSEGVIVRFSVNGQVYKVLCENDILPKSVASE
jgi:hypothetical protein